MDEQPTRRSFLAAVAAACTAAAVPAMASDAMDMNGNIMTVNGPIAPRAMGTTLPHEHVLVDFAGADVASPERYDADEVFNRVLPFLEAAEEAGVETFVECTPDYLARDPKLLERCARSTGINFITNTGYYGAANDKFVPAHAYEESADALAERWIAEWENGIGDTGVKPGFIKTAVDNGDLWDIDAKLVRAAAKTHAATGLTIASHTTDGKSFLQELDVLAEEGVAPEAIIWVHAQTSDDAVRLDAAKRGAWIELDGINDDSIEAHVAAAKALKEADYLDQILLSHDAGWYSVGEPNGGDFRGFTTLFEKMIPAMREAGFTEKEVRQITTRNPARAFTVQKRMLP